MVPTEHGKEMKMIDVIDNEGPVLPLKIKRGPLRSYLVSEPDVKLSKVRKVSTLQEKLSIALLALVTIYVRLRKLQWPNSVVFDEVHFGGFASKYIRGDFFMDVHPPLAKMLFAAVGSMAGFTGDFDFDAIGDEFPKQVPYVSMRFFSAVLGSLTVILLYLTLRSSGVRSLVCFIAALCFAIENSYVTVSRYILLDSPLIFFIAAAAYAFKRYEVYPSNSWRSLQFLIAAGIGLGLAVSSKWVGLFTIAWVGLLCIWRLWFMIGDLDKPVSSVIKTATLKALCLLALPATLYIVFFQIHFSTLTNVTEGAAFYSPEFITTLQGNRIPQNIVADVGFGSVLTIRHLGTSGGYIHSHKHMFPTGSGQQQLTLYGHIDGNNDWIVEVPEKPLASPNGFINITDGARIRLVHKSTGCRLHSHDFKAPISEFADWQKEVSCYGYTGFPGDINDDWIVEIDKDETPPGEAQEAIKAIKTKFRLKHATSGCYLFSHDVKLPKWGFGQQEVTCATSGKAHLTLWSVEANQNHLLPTEGIERLSYNASTFWQKLWESHKVMWHVNKNLKEPHIYESQPTTWPFLLRGINYWGHYSTHVYLFGNPLIWWSVTAFLAMFVLGLVFEFGRWTVGKNMTNDPELINFYVQTIHFTIGFIIHYAPFFLMQRQMFLHHYLPAYYFGILALGHGMDLLVSYVLKRKKQVAYAILMVFLASSMFCYHRYSPIIYGSPWTKSLCEQSKLLSSWDFNCQLYFNDLAEYDSSDYKQSLVQGKKPPNTATMNIDEIADQNKPPEPSIISSSVEEIENIIGGTKFEEIMQQPGNKKFVDEMGNELDLEQVKEILEEQGGVIKDVKRRVVSE